jgi:hypothetical protein
MLKIDYDKKVNSFRRKEGLELNVLGRRKPERKAAAEAELGMH